MSQPVNDMNEWINNIKTILTKNRTQNNMGLNENNTLQSSLSSELKEQENKLNVDEDSDDDYYECIINPGNDRRIIVCDTQNKNDDIIKCMVTVESHYIPDTSVEIGHGTGTVIHINDENVIFVLTAAHNVCGMERECKSCAIKTLKHACPNTHCNSQHETTKTGKLIKPKDIYFARRGNGINHKLGQSIERYQVDHYEIPDKYYTFSRPHDGYDICIITCKCHDVNGINLYKQNCSKITLIQDIKFGGNESVLYIYGYPGSKREEKDHRIYYYLYGMGTSKIDTQSRFKIVLNAKNKAYIVNKTIDTTCGQSGSCIYSYNNTNTGYLIYGIHVGGSQKQQSNFGTFFDDDNMDWIKNVLVENNVTEKYISSKFIDAFDNEEYKNEDAWGDVVEETYQTINDANKPDLSKQCTSWNIDVDPLCIDLAMQTKVKQLAKELSLHERKCLLLLRRYEWNMTKIIDLYFIDCDKILVSAGICIHPISTNKNIGIDIIECEICMDNVMMWDTFNLECGHLACKSCWIDYLTLSVKTKQCVHLTCPKHKCYVSIPQKIWHLFLNDKYKNELNRYHRFCRDNFIENNKDWCFCPGIDCAMVHLSESGIAREIVCSECGYEFCWKCKNESHFPSSCQTATKWLQKCSSLPENITWILTKTKKCPKCHVNIEKNQGCNHMTCIACGHEFCWLCKGDWNKHPTAKKKSAYRCNIYEQNKTEGKLSEEETAQQNAQNETNRYEFHFTRFYSHRKSSKYGYAWRKFRLNEKIHEKMHQLALNHDIDLKKTQFLLDAANEAMQCWHVLAWTYPIAYYLDDKKFNLDLLRYQQGKLENFC
eukprot:282772_1